MKPAPAQCINGVSKLTELDGCGNTRLVDGGNACVVVVPDTLEYVGIGDGMPISATDEYNYYRLDARVKYSHLGFYGCASAGSRHCQILGNIPDYTPIKVNPEWVVANKYCAIDTKHLAGKNFNGGAICI